MMDGTPLQVNALRTQVGFVIIDAKADEDGSIVLKLTATDKGKLTKAKLGIMPLPLKLNVKKGTALSFTITAG